MRRTTYLVAALLALAPVAGQAYSVQLSAEGVADADLQLVRQAVEKAGHSLAAAPSAEELDAIKRAALNAPLEDLSARVGQAQYILTLRPRAGLWLAADVYSLASGEFVRSGALSKDKTEADVAALFEAARAVAAQVTAVPSATGSWQQVQVRGYAKKGSPTAVAAKVAVIDAKRAAVETILGATVNLKLVADAKSVQSSVEGQLRYTQVGQGTDERGPWVEILAGVFVPEELKAQAPAEPPFPKDSGLLPLVHKLQFGSVDWGKGVLRATGRAKLAGKDAVLARRAAIVDAQANALAITKLLALNGDKTLGEVAAGNAQLALKLEGTVHGGRVVAEKSSTDDYTVELELPLHGVKGVQSAFVEPVQVMAFDAPLPVAGEDTGVIIDMRGTGSVAALLPTVVESDGTVIFDPQRDMDPAARQAHGFAAYASGLTSAGELYRGWQYMKGEAASDGSIRLAWAGEIGSDADPMWLAQAPVAPAARPQVRRAPVRQGTAPRTVAARPGGRLPTNIVFSTGAEDKKQFYARLNKSLKSGRVVILADTAIGGVEGRLFRPSTASLAQ